jgi:hypothetical protein
MSDHEIELKIYTGSIPSGLTDTGSEYRRLYEAIDDAARNGASVTITRGRKTFRLTPVGEPTAPRTFTRGWKEQPPLAEIAQAMTDLFDRGLAAHSRDLRTGTDQYAWIVSGHAVSDEEAEELLFGEQS